MSRKKYSVKAESRVSRRSVSIEVGMATSTLNRQTVQPSAVPYSAMAIQVQCVLAVRASRLRASPSSSVVHREQHCGVHVGYMGPCLRRRADTDGQGRGRRDTYPTRIESCVSLRPGGSEGPRPFLCLSEFSCLGHVTPTGSDNKSRTGAMHAFSTTARLTVPHRAQQQSSVSVTHRSRGAMPARWSNETNDPPDPVTGQASPPLHQVDTTLTMILKLRLTRTHRASSFLGPWRPWYRPYPQGSHGFLELN